MPDVLYVGERRTSAFHMARLATDVVYAGDSPRMIKHLSGMVRAVRDAGDCTWRISNLYDQGGAVSQTALALPECSHQRTIFNLGSACCSLCTPASVTLVPPRTSMWRPV